MQASARGWFDPVDGQLGYIRSSQFKALTGGDLVRVLDGLKAAQDAGFDEISLNVVALKEINEGHLADIATPEPGILATSRFIELMPIGALPYQRVLVALLTDD